MKVGVVQLQITLADVSTNLARAAAGVEEAVRRGAELILLPEFFSSGIAFDPEILEVPRRQEATRSRLTAWAEAFGVAVGGSFLTFDGSEAHNTFVLAFPDGTTFEHRKDLPTMLENAFYAPGGDDGVFDTCRGRIGVALCWEMIRTRTVERLLGRVDFVLAASCWWGHRPPYDGTAAEVQLRNEELLREAPRQLARLLAVPVIHASCVGRFETASLSHPQDLRPGRFLGRSQILASDAAPVAALASEAGILVSDLPPQKGRRRRRLASSGYWTLPLTDAHLRAWERDAELGGEYYRTVALPHYAACRDGD